jgi:SNF2 family DNA or RNA helicase
VQTSWSHQTTEIERYAFTPRHFRFWDPRTGKTRVSVYEHALWINAGLRRALVVAPATACSVWLDAPELGRFDPAQVRVIDLSEGSIAERRETLYALHNTDLPTIVVVNRDVIFKERPRGNDTLTGLCKALADWAPEALTLDECHAFKTPSSRRTRAATQLAKHARFRRGLTGTPDPTSYRDLYAQYRIIAPEVFGARRADFDERYCIMNRFYPKVERYVNVDELKAKMLSRASVIRQADCFDMPDILPDIMLPVPFTKLARELYDELTKNFVADFLGAEIDATHQLARLAILHQLAQGFIRHDDGEVEWVFEGKIKAALEYAGEMLRSGKRLVIFHHYRPEGQRLADSLGKIANVGVLNGDTPKSQRSPAPFRDNPSMQIFVAQEETANLSISLAEADHVLWYSYGCEWDVDYQARQRIFAERSKKPHGLSYTFLEVPQTTDRFMYRTARRKQIDSEALRSVGFKEAAYGI